MSFSSDSLASPLFVSAFPSKKSFSNLRTKTKDKEVDLTCRIDLIALWIPSDFDTEECLNVEFGLILKCDVTGTWKMFSNRCSQQCCYGELLWDYSSVCIAYKHQDGSTWTWMVDKISVLFCFYPKSLTTRCMEHHCLSMRGQKGKHNEYLVLRLRKEDRCTTVNSELIWTNW